MNDCIMCQIRATLKKAMLEVDALPEVNSALYDDAVSAAYQALETAYDQHTHSCNELQPEKHHCPSCTWRIDVELVNGVCPQCGVNWHKLNDLQPCGHPLSAIVQAEEGTAFCGMCADEARLHGVVTGTGI